MTGLKAVHHVSRNGCLKHIWYEVGRCEQWLPQHFAENTRIFRQAIIKNLVLLRKQWL